jgi:hypothetical protein
LSRDGTTVEIQIYDDGKDGWLLEVVDEFGNSTVWDESFLTDDAALAEALNWYLRYSLSLRDVEELFAERGLEADHTTIWRWVQRYGPELEQRLRRHLRPFTASVASCGNAIVRGRRISSTHSA